MAKTPIVAIIGRPNVGKSTLFNRMVGWRTAITASEAGTTRDAVSGQVDWGKHHFILNDTAGYDSAADDIEGQAQDQLRSSILAADVVVVVVDATTEPTNQDLAAAKLAHKSKKPVILAINKADVKGAKADFKRLGIKEQIRVSAIHGSGSGDLLDAIATHIAATPATLEQGVISLALLGRPNVGKSSLLNNLAGEQLAIVSGQAGTTRDIRSTYIKDHGQTIQLLDTAGLRRRGKITPGVEKFSTLRTAQAIESADICAVILDATELGTAGDQHIAGMVRDAGKGLILVVNKWDAIEKDDKTQARIIRGLARDFEFAPWAPLIFTSAETGLHTRQILQLAREIYARRDQKLPTGPLNRVVEDLVRKHPPAGLKRVQPKLNYVTQTDTQPPTFTFFTNHPKAVHFSYQRYLENGLRAAYDFAGTPIKLEFRSKRRGE